MPIISEITLVYTRVKQIIVCLKKIIEKLKFGSCKTKVASDVNAFTESEKKKSDDIEK